jgi:hypothetical protein
LDDLFSVVTAGSVCGLCHFVIVVASANSDCTSTSLCSLQLLLSCFYRLVVPQVAFSTLGSVHILGVAAVVGADSGLLVFIRKEGSVFHHIHLLLKGFMAALEICISLQQEHYMEQPAQEGSHMSDVLLFESPIRLTD